MRCLCPCHQKGQHHQKGSLHPINAAAQVMEWTKCEEERDAAIAKLEEVTKERDKRHAVASGLQRALSAVESERDKLKSRLDFLKEKGITVGMMKTSAKPDPYLVYVIEYGSEMCEMRTINKLIDAEIERDMAIKERDEARMLLETMTHSQIEIGKERDQISDLLDAATTKCERGLCAGAALFAGADGNRMAELERIKKQYAK